MIQTFIIMSRGGAGGGSFERRPDNHTDRQTHPLSPRLLLLLTRMDARADTQCSTVVGEEITEVSEIFNSVEEARLLKYTDDTAHNRDQQLEVRSRHNTRNQSTSKHINTQLNPSDIQQQLTYSAQ